MADGDNDHFLRRLRGKDQSIEELALALPLESHVSQKTISNIELRVHIPRRKTCRVLYDYFKGESRTTMSFPEFFAAIREDRDTPASSAARPPASAETLDRATLEALLRNGFYGRAGFCSYLIGDYSILLTRVAVGIPPNALVHAAVECRTMRGPSSAQVYYRHGPSRWKLDEAMSERMSRHLTAALGDEQAQALFGCPPSVHAVIASELPDGTALYEESAISLAVASAIVPQTEPSEDHFETLRLAAHLVRQWYCDVSWATLSIGSFDPIPDDRCVLRFDRSDPAWDVDLPTLYNLHPRQRTTTEYERRQLATNFAPDKKYWKTESLPFNTDQIEIWWDGRRSHVDENTIRNKFSAFRQLPFNELAKRVCETIVDGGIDGERRLGLLMQLHQLMLASVDFIDPDAQKVVASVNGLSRFVLGAKLASGRVRGAFMVLIDRGIDHDEFDHAMRKLGLLPLSEFRSRLEPHAVR